MATGQHASSPEPVAVRELSKARRTTIRSLTVLGLLLFGFFTLLVVTETSGIATSTRIGDPDDPPPSEEALAGAATPGESVHLAGSLVLFVIGASGLVTLIARPEQPGAALQVLAVMAGVLATAILVGDPDNTGGQAGPFDVLFLVVALPGLAAGLLARPWRKSVGGPQFPILVLAAIGAAPAIWFGVTQGLIQRNTFPPSADPHHNAHWWAMSAMAFIAVTVLVGASVGRPGWRMGAAIVGIGAVALGAASLVAAEAASALAPLWAAATMLWGGAIVVVAVSGRDSLSPDSSDDQVGTR